MSSLCKKRVLFGQGFPSPLPRLPKRTMSNRLEILSMIHAVMIRIKNSANREQRFNLLDNVQILTDILQEVTIYEKNLIMDLDVD